MEWSETIADKGTVNIGETITHTFIYNGDKQIKKVVPLCDCIKSSVHGNRYMFTIKVKTKAKKISKMIEVRYTDDTRTYLIIKAQINETK